MLRNLTIIFSLMFIAACTHVPEYLSVDQTKLDCAEIESIEYVVELAPDHAILLGEAHGTVEAPEMLEAFSCHILNAGLPVKIGLETIHSQSSDLNAALDGPLDVQSLYKAAPMLWIEKLGGNTQHSEAILALLMQVSEWRAMGFEVSVFGFDERVTGFDDYPPVTEMGHILRDILMAKNIDNQMFGFDGAVIGLSGNFHVSKKPYVTFEDTRYYPMANFLMEREPFSIGMLQTGGTIWANACVNVGTDEETCGFRRTNWFPSQHIETVPKGSIVLDHPKYVDYDAVINLGELTASPPAFPETPDATQTE